MFVKSVDNEDIARLPLAAFEGSISVIDKPGKDFEHAIRYLKTKSILGFDTESRPCFSAHQPHFGVALLQLSGAEKAFLFRIKTLGMQKKLCRILSDANILKIGAAVADDIRGL